MPGATSSAVHALTVEDGAGRREELVLRRFTDAAWLAREPDLAAREAEALALVEATAVATPRLIAFDATGEHCDVPAVLMTRLPGRPNEAPDDVDAFVTGLAEPLPPVHEITVSAPATLPEFRPYYLDDAVRGAFRPPAGSRVPEAWERAIEVHIGPAPGGVKVLLHRDYHPGNVLWRRGRVSGVVDWVNASSGPADADLGHCRMNLALDYGHDAADRFLAAYRALTRQLDYHPYWDIVAAVGMISDDPDFAAADEFITRAVARL
jgi:aminoglycoside phosphotransferase (APT) family kinase protein